MTDKQSADVILFDFRTEMLKALGSLANEKYPDLPSSANVLASTLFGGLTAYQKHERAEPFKNELIACLFIAGYFNKEPSWVVIEFKQSNQVLLAPVVNAKALAKRLQTRRVLRIGNSGAAYIQHG
jgi:hypothetical protein